MAQSGPEYRDPPASQRAAARDADTPIVETTTEARQGVTGHGARYVLIISTVAVVIAFVVIYTAFFAGA
jgi:cobalamin biosynthesis Mg chelatase CobN